MGSNVSLHNLIVALFVVLVLVLILTAGVLVYSFIKFKTINNRQNWIVIIEDKIMSTIVDGYQPMSEDANLSSLLQNKQFRLLFLESMIASTRRFSGAAIQELSKLFQELDLRKNTLHKLSKGNRIHFISEGIQELTEMETREVIPEIQSFINNPNPVIYQEAQYAMVRFEGFEGLFFFDNLKHTLSDWQQMRLLDSVKSIPSNSREAIISWLHSSNDSIVIFTFRLIRKFQLLEYYSDIEGLMTHKNPKIRIKVVRALQALENESTIDTLIKMFDQEDLVVQKEILKVLKISKNNKSDEFLKLQLTQNVSSDLKLIAAEALAELGETEFLQSLSLDDTDTSMIVKHVLREKI